MGDHSRAHSPLSSTVTDGVTAARSLRRVQHRRGGRTAQSNATNYFYVPCKCRLVAWRRQLAILSTNLALLTPSAFTFRLSSTARRKGPRCLQHAAASAAATVAAPGFTSQLAVPRLHRGWRVSVAGGRRGRLRRCPCEVRVLLRALVRIPRPRRICGRRASRPLERFRPLPCLHRLAYARRAVRTARTAACSAAASRPVARPA